ncbi:MAG: DEAD/DEAH box helicase, partial [Cyanobacteria bacterium P01_G01_bin.38]
MLAPEKLFPFELDTFQHEAIHALNQGKSVIVCAPTGSGKTLVGEYAIHRALDEGKRVFYTTPLKALSNQKLRDFREQFGQDRVGLLTGDISVNRDAPILVMTTEIFRNMLYGTAIGEVGTSLKGVQTVVLDECHYMNDRQRGTVWEESIIYCPPEIQVVGLSATVANGDQLTDWIHQIHGPTELIYSDYRPVPLDFHFATEKGIFPLLNDQKTAIHPRLKGQRKPPRKQRGQKKKLRGANLATTISRLQQRDMLPAIYFIFSRRGCDKSVQEVADLSLVNPDEAARLKQRIDAFLA